MNIPFINKAYLSFTYFLGIIIGIVLSVIGMSGPTTALRNPAHVIEHGSFIGWAVGLLALGLAGAGLSSDNHFLRGITAGVLGTIVFCSLLILFVMFIGFPLFVLIHFLLSWIN